MRKLNVFGIMLVLLLSLTFIVAEELVMEKGLPVEEAVIEKISYIPKVAIEDKAGWSIDNVADFIKTKDNPLGTVSIKNSFLWILPQDTIEEISLKENTYTCGSTCSAEKEITIYTDTKLIDSIKFLKLEEASGKWSESILRSYQFYIRTNHTLVEKTNTYDLCPLDIKDSKDISNCKPTTEVIKTYEDTWEPYNYEVMPAGTYYIKLVGEKRAEWTYDWIITSQGKEIREWAIWNGYKSNTNKVVWYKFTSGSGTVVVDTVGFRNGTYDNAPVWELSNWTNFGNASRHIDAKIMNSTLYSNATLNDNFTIEMRLTPADTTSAAMLTWGAPGTNGWGLTYDGSNKLSWKAGSCGQVNGLGNAWTADKPTYFVVIRNSTTWRFYMDGALMSTQSCATPSTQTGNFIFGLDISGYFGGNYLGQVDNLIIWDRALTDAEVLAANSSSGDGSAGTIVSLTDPVNYYNSSTRNAYFNCSVTNLDGTDLANVSWMNNGVINVTNTFVEEGLVAYYKLNDNTTTQAVIDSTGGNASLVNMINTQSLSTIGKINNAFNFWNASIVTGSMIQLQSEKLQYINTSKNISVCAWINPSSYRNITSQGNGIFGRANSFSLYIKSNNIVAFGFGNDTGSLNTEAISMNPIANNSWSFICGTYMDRNLSFYLDGRITHSLLLNALINRGSVSYLRIASADCLSGTCVYFNGSIDEVRMYNRTLSPAEVLRLYQMGLQTIESKTSSVNDTLNYTFPSDTSANWTCQACDVDGVCNTALTNRTITIDSTAPVLQILYPVGVINGLTNGQSFALNFTKNELYLSSCWRDYNGANTTIAPCQNTTFTYASGINSIKLWANDSAGNLGVASSTWGGVSINSVSYNDSSYETEYQTFFLNATNYTSAILVYNGSRYTSTVAGQIATASLDIPSISGNKSFYWEIDGVVNSSIYNQFIQPATFAICNTTNNVPYLNISFMDETTLTAINASVNAINASYYLGSGTKTASLYYINTVENAAYDICFINSSKVVKTIGGVAIRYYSTGYPAKTTTIPGTFNSSASNIQVLYLLSSSDGIDVTFQVVDNALQALSGALVTLVADGLTVASGSTDSAGTFTAFLNTQKLHSVTVSKTGYDTYVSSIYPTQTQYSIILTSSSSAVNITNPYAGISYQIRPYESFLTNATTYPFNVTINSSYYTLEEFGIRITNGTTQIISSGTTGNSGTVNVNVNTGNNNSFYVYAYWIINGTTIYSSPYIFTIWSSLDTDWSINNFTNDLNNYLTSGMFGLTKGFNLNLLIFFIIFIITGVMSWKFGLTSSIQIAIMVFVLTALFDIGLNLITTEVSHISTIITFIIMLGIGIKEAYGY